MLSPEHLVALSMLVPLAAVPLIALCDRRPDVREAITLLAAVLLLGCVAVLTPLVIAGARPALSVLELLPGLGIEFRVEPLGMLFGLVASSLWIVNSLYSIGYMRGNGEAHQTRFFMCFALSLSATMGIAFAGNLLTLFVFYEMLTLVTYPLVTHHGDARSRTGGRTYLGVLMGTSIAFLLPALVFIAYVADSTQFTSGGLLKGKLDPATLSVLLALCMFGIGKAALMPFHRWLPAAMVAPTPVSALLHAVAVVKAGVFSVVKVIVYVFGIDTLAALDQVLGANWLIWISGFTIVAASTVALRADNLKRRLAYSTISQLSYVVMAAAVLAPLSVVAAALHIAAHAFGKITLFFAAGAIYTAAHKTEVSELDGIGHRMPWTMGAFAVGSLSMIGLPPAVGFVSKWFMLSGAMQAQQWLAVAVIIVSTLLSAGYLLPIVYRAFFRPIPLASVQAVHGEAPLPMVLALVMTATMTIALFFVPELPLALARLVVAP